MNLLTTTRARARIVIGCLALLVPFLVLFTHQTAAEAAVSAAPTSIVPGNSIWRDTSGNVIHNHAGQVVKNGSTYYWFGSALQGTASGFTGENVYTSTDLVNWTFDNEVLAPTASGDLSATGIVEGASVIHDPTSGLWVMYMHIDNASYSHNYVGVATSSTIDGNYSYQGSFQTQDKSTTPATTTASLDIHLYQDSTGTYLLSADNVENKGIYIYKLSPQYLTTASSQTIERTMSNPRSSTTRYEAPVIFKHNNLYYLVESHASGWTSNDNVYQTATSLSGPWSAPVSLAMPYSANTYDSQVRDIFPVTTANKTTLVFLADRWTAFPSCVGWCGANLMLPMAFNGNTVSLPGLYDTWTLNQSTADWASGETVDDSTTGTGLNQFHYSGSWVPDTSHAAWGNYSGTHTYSHVTGDQATIQFRGTEIDVYAVKGPNTGIANVSIDGATPTAVDTFASTNLGDQLISKQTGLTDTTHTLTVTVTGTHSSSSTDSYIALDRVVVPDLVVNDSATGTGDNQFNYVGAWGTASCGGCYPASNPAYHWDGTTGDSATFTFTGTRVGLYASVGPSNGIASVQIDGGTASQVDLYAGDWPNTGSPSTAGDQLVWRSPALAYGTHTLTWTNTGTNNPASSNHYVQVDRVDVTR